jgi:hypothetical protein
MLKGKQKKLDANKDGEISKDDFKMLQSKKEMKVVKASEGQGIRKGQEHKAKIKDAVGTAKGYIKGLLGANPEKTGSKADEIRQKYLAVKQKDPTSPIRENIFDIENYEKNYGKVDIDKKSKGGSIFSRQNYRRTGKI